MNIDLGDINYLAVVLGIIISMAGGALWYSPILFAKLWMAENGFTEEELKEKGTAMQGYVVSIGGAVISVFLLAILIQATGANDFGEGLLVGLIGGAGFIGMSQAANYTFESRSLKLYLINTGYPVLILAINGVILALWT